MCGRQDDCLQLMRIPWATHSKPWVMTTRSRWAVLLGLALAVALLSWTALPLFLRWRTERTARLFAQAMFRGDSAALAQLSSRGSAQTALCLREHWPSAFWERRHRPLIPRRLRVTPDEVRYELVGDPLPAVGGRAVYEVYVSRHRPDRIASIFADYRLGVWTPEVRGCLRP